MRPVGIEATTGGPVWGRPLLVALIALIAVLWLPGRRISPRVWVVGAVGLVFWVLAAFYFIPGREPEASRYMYLGGIVIILVLAEVFDGVRLNERVLALFAAGTAAIVASNLGFLVDSKRIGELESQLARANLGAIEIARDTVRPDFWLDPDISGSLNLIDVSAGPYLSAADAHGSAADTPTQIFGESELVRQRVDDVLAHALRVGLVQNSQARPRGRAPSVLDANGLPVQQTGSCTTLPEGTKGGIATVRIAPPGSIIRLAAGEPAKLQIRRFARGAFPVTLADLRGGTARLRIPMDRSRVPWQLGLHASQAVTLCGGGG
jgi:hypothetical protein